jgi:hypothetical protein
MPHSDALTPAGQREDCAGWASIMSIEKWREKRAIILAAGRKIFGKSLGG